MTRLDRDLISEVCKNLVSNPSSHIADLATNDLNRIEVSFLADTLDDGTPAAGNPFKVFLINRTCANTVIDCFWKLPVLSIYSSYGSFEKNDPSYPHLPLSHSTLAYLLKTNDCKIQELRVWDPIPSVLCEIRSQNIRKMIWKSLKGTENLENDSIRAFERILIENSGPLEDLNVDEIFLPHIPFEKLSLETFTIPYFSGTFDQQFFQRINSNRLILNDASKACCEFHHVIYSEGCPPNNHIKHLEIDFDRTFHQEFRHRMNLYSLVLELPLRFPNLQTFKFSAEQDALLEEHFNKIICLREFGRAICNIEDVMQDYNKGPFEFLVDVFCFVPRAALQFMLTNVLFGYFEAELLPEDHQRYAFMRLEKYFGKDPTRKLTIRLC